MTNCMACAEGSGRHAIDCPRNDGALAPIPGPVNIVIPFRHRGSAEDVLTRIQLALPVRGYITDAELHELPERVAERLAVGRRVEIDSEQSTFHGREGEIVERYDLLGRQWAKVRFNGHGAGVAFEMCELRPAWSSRESRA